MRAEDLSMTELLKIDPKKGFPLFGSHRIVITGISSLRRFGDDLTHHLGLDSMGRLLARVGYENGLTAAAVIGDMYDFDSRLEWFHACKVVMRVAGIVEQEITRWEYEEEKNRMRFEGIWHDSFEALNYLNKKTGLSPQPICNLLSGFLSGYASAVFGREILVRETACKAAGSPECTFSAYFPEEGGEELKAFRDSLTLSTLEGDISRLEAELKQSREDLAKSEAEIARLKKQARVMKQSSGIVYRGKSMANLMMLAEKIAATDLSVLIQGESGTGKELVARFIHDHSGRKRKPFFAINCAALPSNLLETELFGYTKGAFTGADSNRKGLLLDADGGTFFLDEVGEMPLALQAKLLRVLQEKEVRPVGGSQNMPLDVRIVAATNRDLKQMIEKGDFREDLFYRLSVFPLNVEPLRRRKEDILILARHFLSRMKPSHPGLEPEVVRCLENHSWPGNIRELENTMEYALVMSPEAKISPAHLPSSITQSAGSPLQSIMSELPSLEELELRYANMVLEHTSGNKTEAARILGIGTTTLWRYLQK